MPKPKPNVKRDAVPVMAMLGGDARSRRLLAERTELIGWLAGAVAHDVNNVLAAIGGYAELIEGDLDPGDPHAADAAGIREAVQRAGTLVRQLLLVGRRETLRLEDLDAADLVDNLLPLLSSACGDRVSVHVERSAERVAVHADRSLLEQALLNLAVNARDAMPSGGTLTLRVVAGQRRPAPSAVDALAETAPGTLAHDASDEVTIEVEDTGVGIDPAVLPRVFERYFSTKDPAHGSGIGLAVVEEAAARCGGRVTVASRPGVGTRFALHLPRAAEPPVAVTAVRRPAPVRGGTESILVVESDPEVRLVVVRLMHRLGYRVADVATPHQALALVEHAIGPLDLLVSETAFPGFSGADLADRIRAVHPGLPVLYLSRTARGTARSPGGTEPSVPALAKPFTAERLGAAMRGLLDGRLTGAAEG
jgi:two-component system cell cycle sensor histidine kinase/response regulator CckA